MKIIGASELLRGVAYIRLLPSKPGAPEFVPFTEAPIGTIGEYVVGVCANEWRGDGRMIAVRAADTAPVAPMPVSELPPGDARGIQRILWTAAGLCMSAGHTVEQFTAAAAVAWAEVERARAVRKGPQ
jgi:hypothetical protein